MNSSSVINDLSSFKGRSDVYYFLSPCGLGDSLCLIGLKKEIEKQLKGKVHFIIKPSHMIVAQLYDTKDYVIASFDKASLFSFALKTPKPELGKIFVAHPDFHPWAKKFVQEMKEHREHLTFLSWYKDFLKLPTTTS